MPPSDHAYDAVLLDFYGTVVHEDDDLVASICRTIAATTNRAVDPGGIGSYWWQTFSASFTASHGDRFQTQRELEHQSLVNTILHFEASCDADALSASMFEHWATSPVFADAHDFLSNVDVPIVVLSNIDRRDIEACIALHGLQFDALVTSDDVRAYKPNRAMFEAGLAATGVADRRRVLHVGDSFPSDVNGAFAADIPVAWVNRTGKRPAGEAAPRYTVGSLSDLLPVVPHRFS